MSFLKRFFGFGPTERQGEDAGKKFREVEHKGFLVRATPYNEGGQFQTCGVIVREVDGEMKEHRFIRADRFAAIEDAIEMSIRKGRQMIDERGEGLFER